MTDTVYLATLAQARSDINVRDDTSTSGDAYLFASLNHVSQRIETLKDCTFEPSLETRTYDARGDGISNDGRTLYLRYPLLSVTEITLGDATVLTNGQYDLLRPNVTPSLMIRLKQSSSLRWTTYSTDWENAISIEGVWGYRHNYSQAWVAGSTLNGALDASTTTVAVASGTPFSPGHLIKIDSEYLRVTAKSDNNLTVERGERGTTAASHLTAAVVSYFVPDSNVNRAALRWAAYLYKRRAVYERASFDGVATYEYPPDAPDEVTGILNSFYNAQGFRAVG